VGQQDEPDAGGVQRHPAPDPVQHPACAVRGQPLDQAGLLRAGTELPARYFGLGDRGVVGPGRRADLVLLGGDPLQDIRATRSIRRVWCGGIERVPLTQG
jgi:imidazolonepropionase-like amidohydrolase